MHLNEIPEGLKTAALREPWLVAAAGFGGLGVMWWALTVIRQYPWLPFISAAIVCILIRVGIYVERGGLLSLVPQQTTSGLHRPFFELFSRFLNAATLVISNIMRLCMLAGMDLTEEQRRELLTGMDPKFRHAMFQQPSLLLLPWPVRRLLLGRAAALPAALSASPPGEKKARGTPATVPSEPQMAKTKSLEERFTPQPTPRIEERCTSVDSISTLGFSARSPRTTLRRKSTADNLLDVVRGMEGVARSTRASANVSSLEKILTEKMMGTTAGMARSLATSAQAQALQTLEIGKAKVSELGEGVLEVVTDTRTQVTAASAVGGAVALGTGGGAAGLVSGGIMGAAIGIVPAIFTFGLSIPIGAAIGGGVGLAAGSTIAGTAGLVGGGSLGYYAYGDRSQLKALKEHAP